MILIDSYLSEIKFPYKIFDEKSALGVFKPRDSFGHKGTYGHALILAGGYGKMGAALLAARACLCAGAGLLTMQIPSCGYEIMQTSLPEAMVATDRDEYHLSEFPNHPEIFQSIGIGPGIGKHPETTALLKKLIKKIKSPLVLDADALNIISTAKEFLNELNPDTIITPHPKEFDRLFGESKSDHERMEKAHQASAKYKIYIILKGHFTAVFSPDGNTTYNTTGNPGMAKGGSGDVLTGIITGLLAQSYTPSESCRLGVFLHGWAGDIAAELYSLEAMLPSDLINCLGKVFLKINKMNFNHVI
jgi:ADP-dependent NAD(P)H-hydrate dehydratase / NAD(P)H-hydrate epimerase